MTMCPPNKFMEDSRVRRAVSRVAVVVRERIGSFVRHSEETAEIEEKGLKYSMYSSSGRKRRNCGYL
jgi:hypothetical protein